MTSPKILRLIFCLTFKPMTLDPERSKTEVPLKMYLIFGITFILQGIALDCFLRGTSIQPRCALGIKWRSSQIEPELWDVRVHSMPSQCNNDQTKDNSFYSKSTASFPISSRSVYQGSIITMTVSCFDIG